MKSRIWLAAAIACAGALPAAPSSAQNVGTNAGIWWTPAANQAPAFTLLNPLSTVYGRIGFLRSFNNSPTVTGVSVPPGLTLTVPDSWGGVLGIGVRLMPVLRYELQLGGTFNNRAGLAILGVPVVGANVRISSVQLMNNVYVDIAPFFGNNLWGLNPYGFVGIGVAWNSTGDLNAPGPVPGSGATRTQFAWNAGAGVQWQAMRNLIVDVNYRYVDVGRFAFSPTIPIPFGASISRGTAHQILVSVVVPIDGLMRGFGN